MIRRRSPQRRAFFGPVASPPPPQPGAVARILHPCSSPLQTALHSYAHRVGKRHARQIPVLRGDQPSRQRLSPTRQLAHTLSIFKLGYIDVFAGICLHAKRIVMPNPHIRRRLTSQPQCPQAERSQRCMGLAYRRMQDAGRGVSWLLA